jgi:hypothetical protein
VKKLFYTTLLGLFSVLAFASHPIDHSWKTVEHEQKNGITARFKIRNNPNLTLTDWISLEIDNQTNRTLFINHATYSIDCKVYDKPEGKLLVSGRIASRSVAELFDEALDSPLPTADLDPGLNISSKYPSTIGSFLLALPDQQKVYVKATLNLSMQFIGPENFLLQWEQVPFDFEWFRPEAIEISQLYHQLDTLLSNPLSSSLQHYQLSTLLGQPEISKGFEVTTLLSALQKRSGKNDGRLAILQHLNKHFPNDTQLIDYYFTLLQDANPIALQDLSKADNIWDDHFLEPLIQQYEAGTKEQMVCVMRVLYNHQEKWLKKEGIPTILSDLTLYKFENIIYENPRDLNLKELLTAALVLDLLGKTGDPKVSSIICPFLSEDERILKSDLQFDPYSLELPRPMRVCDNALEALMRLNKIDIIKSYKKAKFNPPYENGDGEIIINRIRDHLISSIQKKTCN